MISTGRRVGAAHAAGKKLKADGRLVEVLPGGGERESSPDPRAIVTASHQAARAANPRVEKVSYAKNVRGRTGLTQTAFAARIGVPVETVRNSGTGRDAGGERPGARATQGAGRGARGGFRGAGR